MKLPYLLFFGVLQLKTCENANILGIAPMNGKSHFNMFEALFKGLAAKGHNVDVVSHFPLREKVPRYNDIPIKGNFPDLVNNMTVDFIARDNLWSFLHIVMFIGGPKMCKDVFETETLRNLRNTTKKYDLLITEMFASDCMLGFSHLFGIPTVALTTSVAISWTSPAVGFSANPSYIPNYFSSFSSKMSLIERVINTGIYFIAKIAYETLSVVDSNILAKNFFGPDLPDIRDLAKNVSLHLVNSHFSMHMSRPVVPNFVEVAGLHINEDHALPKHFQDSLKTNLNGVIYLSFGSMLLTESFPEKTLQALFDAFRKVPYKILWKATKEKFSKNLEIPSNIQFESWMPQLGILCHPNVKLFVSHGGMLGSLEAVHCGVPVLGIPIFADQALNIQSYVAKRVAKHVPYKNVTEESISDALNLLLNDSSYSENMQQMSRLFKDRPLSAMDTAIYWVEYIIKHKGARHLRTVGSDLQWYEYLLLDVALVYVGIVLIALLLLYCTAVFIYETLFRKEEKIKES